MFNIVPCGIEMEIMQYILSKRYSVLTCEIKSMSYGQCYCYLCIFKEGQTSYKGLPSRYACVIYQGFRLSNLKIMVNVKVCYYFFSEVGTKSRSYGLVYSKSSQNVNPYEF